ncbi:unnamed protein product [Rangifer tarandus platyrhynchus]|uniref:Uncharacterized protein n=2 Tax=Rangifer tarandus platyrhynchus TaxID=3082113 RepID=A0AC59YUK7_RANTA|nr:unnamed protein product [Rangifer tarandus platyrhynchus]
MAGLARTFPDSPAPVGLGRRRSSLSRGLASSGAVPPEEGRGGGGGLRGTSGPQRLAPSPPGRGPRPGAEARKGEKRRAEPSGDETCGYKHPRRGSSATPGAGGEGAVAAL